MKKISILSSILLLLVGCAAELENDNPIVDSEIMTVTFEPVTRAQFNGGQTPVWNEGDIVSAFYKQDKAEKWTYTGSEGAYTGTIKRSEVNYGNDLSKSIVVYPYREDYTINTSANTVSSVFPSVQTYRQNSFGEDGTIMIAASENNNVTMKSVVGWLKLQLVGDKTVGTVLVNGNDVYNDILAGHIDINYETLAMNFVAERNFDGITLTCENGVALSQTPTDFYIALPPHKFESGLAVTVKDTEGKFLMTKSIDEPVEIQRNAIYTNLGVMDINQSNVTPAVNSVYNMADASTPGSIHLSVGWDAQFNGVITRVAFEILTADGNTKVSYGDLDLYDPWANKVSYDKAAWAGKFVGNSFTPMATYKVKVTPYIDDIVGTTFEQDIVATGLPAISSIENTAKEDEGIINLVAHWDASFNGKITKAEYVLYHASDYNNPASFGPMIISDDGTFASMWMNNMIPGGEYYPKVKLWIDNIEGEYVDPHTAIYAGKAPVPAMNSMTENLALETDGVIKFQAFWDQKFAGKIDRVAYELYLDNPWTKITSGDMEIPDPYYAEVTITHPNITPGSGPYFVKLTPYSNEVQGETFNSKVVLMAGKAPAPVTPVLSGGGFVDFNHEGYWGVRVYWDQSYKGKIDKIEFKLEEVLSWGSEPDWIATYKSVDSGQMTIDAENCQANAAWFIPNGMDYRLTVTPYNGTQAGATTEYWYKD